MKTGMETVTSPGMTNPLKKIESILPKALGADKHLLWREMIRIKRSDRKSLFSEKTKKRIFRLEKQIQSSIKKKLRRKENLKTLADNIHFDPALPITDKKEDIIRAISENRVMIISGETGSGKTTQIPKFCLAAGRGIEGKIGCTQPRRIAATTVAHRIAEELGEDIGKSVGYKIRFKDQTSEHAYIKIMTDGILLAETQTDPYLNQYDTIIVDEAHERSLNIDFALGILKSLLKKRKDLKLIITSATIDTEKFSKAFDDAPIIKVSGRMYPVEVRYAPPEGDTEEQTHVDAAANQVHQLCRNTRRGDILVFMPTEQDIRETCELLEGKFKEDKMGAGVTILPLYARLSAADQSKVFSRTPGRKIIVATNVAETSITIPGIKYVVDTGLARISQYSPGSRTTSLPVVPVSKSSADQRKGRCGRVENGICIRLFSEEDYENRPLFTPPEILRSNLAEVILRMTGLKLGDISDFPFIDSPAPKNIRDGFNLLLELGAIASEPENRKFRNRTAYQKTPFFLTEKGRLMAKMPIDPRLSRMLIEAQKENCLKEIAVIASVLSLQDPRERPSEKQEDADRMHALFKDPSSDFLTFLNIWHTYHQTREHVSSTNKLKKFCKEHFLSFRRMKEWQDIHAQLRDILEESQVEGRRSQVAGEQETCVQHPAASNLQPTTHNLQPTTYNLQPTTYNLQPTTYAAIHKSVLSGFLSNIATKKEKNFFQGAKDKEVMIFPGSGLFDKAGQWIVAAELVETSRLFARTVANIKVGWLEPLGQYQCKYTYLHPRWDRERGEVMASEQVSLYGLIIVPERPVSYGSIHPDEANRIFIQHALVEGKVKQPLPFMQYNQKLINDVRDMENRLRRRDLLVGEQEIFQFYRERLPGIYNWVSLQSLLKKRKGDRFLRMKKEDLFLYPPDQRELSLFPKNISVGNKIFDCAYQFDPGNHADGLTLRISSDIAPTFPAESLDWLVPGLMAEKITLLIKGLPKAYRKKLVPVADTVNVILNELPGMKTASEKSDFRMPNSSLITALSNFIYQRFGADIPASAWDTDGLPDHLKLRVAVTGPKGEELRSGRDRRVLNEAVSEKADPDAIEAARKKWERTGITAWDFGDLPDAISVTGKNGAKWPVYPGLEPNDTSVSLRLFQLPSEAAASHPKGVAKLFALHLSNELKFLKKTLSLSKEMKDPAKYFGGAERVAKRLYDSIIHDLFCKNIRTEREFFAHAESVSPGIRSEGKKKADRVLSLMKAYHLSRSELYDLEKANLGNRDIINFINGLRDDLSGLVPERFMELYSTEQLIHLERYIEAITIRARRGLVNFEKDQIKADEIKIYTNRLNELVKDLSPAVSEEKRRAVEEYFWLLEEYKVSVFAQELKTSVPVSKKRLDKKINDINRMV